MRFGFGDGGSFRWLLAAGAVLSLAPPALGAPRLEGDARAVEAVERLIERLGGAEVWSRTRTLHLVYSGWRTDPPESVIERSWRDLQTFASYAEFQGRSFERVSVRRSEGGWESRNGRVEPLSPVRQQAYLDYRPGGFYAMIRRFATADADLRLDFEEPRRVLVRSAAGRDLGWWEIDSAGQLVRWGTSFQGEKIEYVYLPIRAFGVVNFPAGGAATDGFWRFVYERVEVSDDALPMSLEPPEVSR